MRPFYRLAYKCVESITLGIFHTRIKGRENVPAGGCLVVANHASFLDPTTIGWAIGREMHFLARKTLFKPPFMKALFSICNVLPIDREGSDMSGLRQIIKMLQGGKMILLFPEGTRTTDGKIKEGEAGAGFIASKADVPILPVRISGTFEALSRGMKWPRYWPLKVVIGKPFFIKDVNFTEIKGKLAYEALTKKMRDEIEKLEDFL